MHNKITYLVHIEDPFSDSKRIVDRLYCFGDVDPLDSRQYFLRTNKPLNEFEMWSIERQGCALKKCNGSLSKLL
jgi:hypothetical protein